MNFVGKLAGAIIGLWLFRHPFGVLAGVFLGHLWDIGAMRAQPLSGGPARSFIAPLFGLAGAIAKSDGRVSEQEIAAAENLMQRMQLQPVQRAEAIARFTAGKQDNFPAQMAIAELRAWCGGRRDLAFLLLDMLLDIVYAEGPLVGAKFALVRKLCWSLGVHERELAALAAMRGYAYAGNGGSHDHAHEHADAHSARSSVSVDAYAILGLQRSASDSEIKRAYRKLISQHHPDKLGDVPDELKRRAEERAREINTAYEKIRAERNIK
jgi:DnaJ like chaperone protein